MYDSIFPLIIIVISFAFFGYGLYAYTSASLESDLSVIIEKYSEIAEKCELGERDLEIKNKIFSAQKEYELNNNPEKSKNILDEIKPVLLGCSLQHNPNLLGFTVDDVFNTLDKILGLAITSASVGGILFGIYRWNKKRSHQKN